MSATPSAPPLCEEFEQLTVGENTDVHTGTTSANTPLDGQPPYDPPPPYTPPEGDVQMTDLPPGYQPPPGGYPSQLPLWGYPPQPPPGGYPPQLPPGGYPPQPPPGGYLPQYPPGGYPPQLPPVQGSSTASYQPPGPGQASAPPPVDALVPVSCHVCHLVNNIKIGPITTIMICSQCKEITPLTPPPPGKQYVRCRCNTLLICSLSACEAICPKDTCKAVSRLQVPPGVMATPREIAETVAVTIQCQVCEKQYSIRRQATVTAAVCSTCGERSPIAPPPAGTKYVRCVCLNLITATATTATVSCPRQICGRSLKIGALSTFPPGSGTFPVHRASMLLTFVNGFNTLQCDVCCEPMNVPKNMTKKLLICNNCKECTPLEPPDPGKKYFRCYCNCLLICPVTANKVVCARSTCKLTLSTHVTDPSAGSKKNVTFQCPVCHATKTSVVPNESRVVQCSCGVQVPIAAAPRGKKYVYCSCNALLVCAIKSTRVRCSRANCRREFNV